MGFSSETMVKGVRKQHVCDGCGKRIETGTPAVRWSGMTDGEFGTCIYHPDCRAAEVALNDVHGWGYGDDWMGLSDLEHDDLPWLAETYPAVYQRMGRTDAGRARLKGEE